MPHADWRQAYRLSWIVQALHCLGLTQYLAMDYWRVNGSYVEFYERLLRAHHGQPTLLGAQMARLDRTLDLMLTGAEDLGQHDIRFGDINWPVEELTFLQLKLDSARFYAELWPFLGSWMTEQHIADAVDFQQQWILGPSHCCHDVGIYSHDIPAMIASAQQGQHTPVQVRPVKLDFTATHYYNNTEDWAREIVWYGRKQTLHKRYIHVVD
jgi:hypothetical protein